MSRPMIWAGVSLLVAGSWFSSVLAAEDEPGVGDAGGGATGTSKLVGPPLPFGLTWEAVLEEFPEDLRSEVEILLPKAAARASQQGRAPGASQTWEGTLASREQALGRAQKALNREMERIQEMEKRVEARWVEANEIRHFAEKACGGSVVVAGPATGVVPPTPEEIEANTVKVSTIVKKMKPTLAADMLQRWDDDLIIEVIQRLSARVTSPILSAMPPEVSGRITQRMATGKATVRIGGTP